MTRKWKRGEGVKHLPKISPTPGSELWMFPLGKQMAKMVFTYDYMAAILD